MTEAQLSESRERPRGPLKVTTTVAFGTLWLTPRIREFLDLYPEIQMSIVLDDGELDLAMRQADVAIRLMPPRQPDLVQRHLMDMHYKVYASADYLKRYGTPKTIEDLDDQRIVVYGDESKPPVDNINWLLEAGARADAPRRPVLKVNNIYGIMRAVQSSLGIAALPDYFAREAPDLVEILPELRGPSFDAYFVYPEELRHSKRIAVFRDFLIKKIGDQSE
jgi:DNA-binding transcriptional LysR family regulator